MSAVRRKNSTGQRASLVAIAARMDNGYRFTLLADEVGMGNRASHPH